MIDEKHVSGVFELRILRGPKIDWNHYFFGSKLMNRISDVVGSGRSPLCWKGEV